jgi:hypothetical protein
MHFFWALKGLLALGIDIKVISIQLYNTSSFQTSINLFTNSLDGKEKMNFLMPKDLTSRTLARKVT